MKKNRISLIALILLFLSQSTFAQIYLGIEGALTGTFGSGFRNPGIEGNFRTKTSLLNVGVFAMGRIKKHRIKSITRTGSLNYSYAVIYNPNPGIKSEISLTNQYHQFGIGYGYAFKNWVFFLNLSAIQTRYGSYGISLSSKSIDSTNFAEFKVTDLSRKWRWNLVPSLEISYAPFAKKLPNLSVGAEWMFHGFENDPLSFKTNINRAAYEVLVQPKFWFCSVRIAYTFSGSIGKNWRPFKEKE